VMGSWARRFVLPALSVVVVLALGCGPGDHDRAQGGTDGSASESGPYLGTTDSDDRPTVGGRLTYGLPAETNSWNPSLGQWAAYSMQVARALFDPLYLFDADGNIQNNLVESSEHNDDYTVWTTRLRSGIVFHNGKPLTAQDVIDSGRHYRESPVLGGTWARATIESSEAIDDLTFRVTTRKPWPTMRQQSTSQFSFVIDPEWVGDENAPFDEPVGTGPFKIESWELGDRMVVTRNPDYWRKDRWGNQLPYLDKIEFRIIKDDQERADKLRQGEIDMMMQTITTPSIAALRDQCRAGALQCFSDEKGETPENLVVLNTSQAPLNSLDARRALAMAIDRKDYVETVTGGLNQPADSMYAPSSLWYTPTEYPGYDPLAAAELVERVKVRNRGVFRFELMAPQTAEAARITQYLQKAWREVGVDVQIVTLDNRARIINQTRGDYQAALTQLFDATHPAAMTPFVDPDQADAEWSLSFSRVNDPEMGDRIEDLLRARPERSDWQAATARLVSRVNAMLPFLWLDHVPRTFMARANVVNVTRSTLPDGTPAQDFHLGSHGLAQIWIKR
jgi:peptide/nickel transport system substrate-binding protein